MTKALPHAVLCEIDAYKTTIDTLADVIREIRVLVPDKSVVVGVFGAKENPTPTQMGLSRKHVVEACDQAIQRMNCEYLDLYFCHRPDPEVLIIAAPTSDVGCAGRTASQTNGDFQEAVARINLAGIGRHGAGHDNWAGRRHPARLASLPLRALHGLRSRRTFALRPPPSARPRGNAASPATRLPRRPGADCRP
jgi:hypothetical protein